MYLEREKTEGARGRAGEGGREGGRKEGRKEGREGEREGKGGRERENEA